MCGIAGYFVTKPDRIRATTLQKIAGRLLLEIETRGRDATGYAYVSLKDKHIYLAKLNVRASEFLQLDSHILNKPNIQKMPRMMLLHTRAATQGLPTNNKNNHPIYSKTSGLCMVHNGWISNDDLLIDEHNLNHDAEVDSEIYLKLIEKFYLEQKGSTTKLIEPIEKATSLVFGSLACAMIQSGRTDTMWIWRDTGQLAVARTDWGWAFASTKYSLMSALLGESSSFDTPKIIVDEPNQGVLLEITNRDKVNIGKVKGADWNSLPDKYNSRVCRTFENGKVVAVRRYSRTNSNVKYYGSDYENGYTGSMGNWNYRNTHSQQTVLPNFSKDKTGATNFNQEDSTDKSKSQPPAWLPRYKRIQIEEEVKKLKKEHNCLCGIEYRCLDCMEKHQYFGMDLDALMTSTMKD